MEPARVRVRVVLRVPVPDPCYALDTQPLQIKGSSINTGTRHAWEDKTHTSQTKELRINLAMTAQSQRPHSQWELSSGRLPSLEAWHLASHLPQPQPLLPHESAPQSLAALLAQASLRPWSPMQTMQSLYLSRCPRRPNPNPNSNSRVPASGASRSPSPKLCRRVSAPAKPAAVVRARAQPWPSPCPCPCSGCSVPVSEQLQEV